MFGAPVQIKRWVKKPHLRQCSCCWQLGHHIANCCSPFRCHICGEQHMEDTHPSPNVWPVVRKTVMIQEAAITRLVVSTAMGHMLLMLKIVLNATNSMIQIQWSNCPFGHLSTQPTQGSNMELWAYGLWKFSSLMSHNLTFACMLWLSFAEVFIC